MLKKSCPCCRGGAKQTRYICHNIKCGKELCKDDILVCGKCKQHTYCSRDCQLKDWKQIHKSICVDVNTLNLISYIELQNRHGCHLSIMGLHAHPDHPYKIKAHFILKDIWCKVYKKTLPICKKCDNKFDNTAIGIDPKYNIYHAWANCSNCKSEPIKKMVLIPISNNPKHVLLGVKGSLFKKKENIASKHIYPIIIDSKCLEEDDIIKGIGFKNGKFSVATIIHKKTGKTYNEELDKWD